MSETEQAPIPTAVFFSGGGRTLANLLDHQVAGTLPIEIRVAIASRSGLKGIKVAERAGVPCLVVPKHPGVSAADYQAAMFDPVRRRGCELVVMAGFLKHVEIPTDLDGAVINIHPSLLPAFGGSGMYGARVHEAVKRRGVQVTGCTVHLVDNVYDNGPILLQRWCEVKPTDTPEQIAAKVFELECEALPAGIRRWIQQR